MRRLTVFHIRLFVPLLPVLVLAGCGTVSSHSTQYVGVPRYPAADPGRVEILREEPARPHHRLGEVFVDTSREPSQERVDAALREEAARLGADAVFLVVDRSWVTTVVTVDPYWGTQVDPVRSRGIVGVAIKYLRP